MQVLEKEKEKESRGERLSLSVFAIIWKSHA